MRARRVGFKISLLSCGCNACAFLQRNCNTRVSLRTPHTQPLVCRVKKPLVSVAAVVRAQGVANDNSRSSSSSGGCVQARYTTTAPTWSPPPPRWLLCRRRRRRRDVCVRHELTDRRRAAHTCTHVHGPDLADQRARSPAAFARNSCPFGQPIGKLVVVVVAVAGEHNSRLRISSCRGRGVHVDLTCVQWTLQQHRRHLQHARARLRNRREQLST